MKKILLAIFLAVFMLSSVLCPVTSALDLRYPEDAWVMSDDLQILINHGNRYIRFNGIRPLMMDDTFYESAVQYEDIEFESEMTEDKYDGSSVSVYEKLSALAVEVDMFVDGYYEESVWYITEERNSEFEQMKQGKGTNFSTKNYHFNSFYGISLGTYSNWKASSEVINFPASKISSSTYDQYPLFVTDSFGLLNYECGIIFRQTDESGGSDYYLLEYADYDRTYFYADGTLADDHDGLLTAYKLEDEKFSAELTEFYDTMPSDELDWIVGNDRSDVVTLIFSTIFFGIIPLAVIVFALIVFIKSRQTGYRRAAIAMLSGASTVIIAFLLILFFITK